MTPLLELSGIEVGFAAPTRAFRPPALHRVIHGVDLTLARGEVLGLVGESGSGKSTLGRTMVRLLAPSAGSLKLDGREIGSLDDAALRPFRGRMQMVFQDPRAALNPRVTVGETLRRPLRAFGRAGSARELLDMVGLQPSFARRYPHELSGGQRQRVGIARALALRPDLVVADEIVSGLDVSTQAHILLLLRRLQAQLGMALVFISHDLSVVRVLCHTVAVLQQGRIVECGPVAEVFAAPQHPYTRALIAAVPLPDPEPGWLDV